MKDMPAIEFGNFLPIFITLNAKATLFVPQLSGYTDDSEMTEQCLVQVLRFRFKVSENMDYVIDPKHSIILSGINADKDAISQVITYTQEALIGVAET